MKSYCLDANIFITAWNVHYPIIIPEFRNLWGRLAQNRDKIIIIKPIFDEIDPILSGGRKGKTVDQLREQFPLRQWLEDNHFKPASIDLADEQEALRLRQHYQTKESAKGVSFNDTILVAYAGNRKYIVVTYEGKQLNYDGSIWNIKIPLACEQQEVECITFSEMLQEI